MFLLENYFPNYSYLLMSLEANYLNMILSDQDFRDVERDWGQT